jgi:hypothetical protein
MRKKLKEEVLEFINSLHQAHEEIREALLHKNNASAQNMLCECQEFAVSLGKTIEASEGEGHITVSYIEDYCEALFHAFEEIKNPQINENKVYKMLKKQLIRIENSIRYDISVRKEIVFFPYKAAMWDSLESIYLAAKEDPECDAYCVPIPYFDLNPDHSLGQMHYEGGEYPENIEVTDWQEYLFEERKPDAVFIHNPYDDWNRVTSVHPRYYSANLKKYTDMLVYVPYYSTSGGMNEGQSLCSAYLYVDYIVIQAQKFLEYFDERIPRQKFLPFGSPKFDRVIHKCKNPPLPPIGWRKKMKGKKIYFYNTSISGMLLNTENFLRKMQYVFQCFEKRNDVCLLWRPHPLLETTFRSMRPQYLPVFTTLKKIFIEMNSGIFDDTPDITDSIALSDAYIGDAGTSVTSLFGMAGKPVFILNNRIHSEPVEDSWLGEIDMTFNFLEEDRFVITRDNRLYISESHKYDYKFFCSLSENDYGNNYTVLYEIDGKKYACPTNAQDILVIGESGVEKRIELDKKVEKGQAFCVSWKHHKYLILLPLKYPAVVRYDTVTGEIRYFKENIDVFVKEKDGQNITGGSLVYRDTVYIASPVDNMLYMLHIESGEIQIIQLPVKNMGGYMSLVVYMKEIWFLPYKGKYIVRWDPMTGEAREYTDFPKDFMGINPTNGCECEEYLFSIPAFYKEYMYLAPNWGNMYLKLNIDTGECIQWNPPFEDGEGKEYFFTTSKSSFLMRSEEEESSDFKIYSYPKRKLYSIKPAENTCKEIEINFDKEELRKHKAGFYEYSKELKYVCVENAFNSLSAFLDGVVAGRQFDENKQLAVYQEIVANMDGNCGNKIYEFTKNKINS